MIRGELRAVLVATVLAIVVGGAWLATSPTGTPAESRPDPTPSTSRAESVQDDSLESLSVPDDVHVAENVATSFATALLRDDLETLRRLTTDDLAQRLMPGRSRVPEPDDSPPNVAIDGIVTEDLRPDHALFQVAVRRDGITGEELQTVTVSVVRSDDAWRVADTAF